MHATKQINLVPAFVLLFVIVGFAGTTQAKSVYVISDRFSTVKAYDIQDDQMEYQTDAENLAHYGGGAVGLALDPDSEILFITYEGSDKIEMINAKTMELIETKQMDYEFGGLAYDTSKQKLYGAQNILFDAL